MGKTIQSDSLTILRSDKDIFAFLGDFTNFSPLMPEQVINWQATPDQCSFEVQGLATLGMRITERNPYESIIMTGEGKIPFGFTLTCSLSKKSESETLTRLVIDSDMNSFMMMMAEKPLENFVNILVSRLKEVMESQK